MKEEEEKMGGGLLAAPVAEEGACLAVQGEAARVAAVGGAAATEVAGEGETEAPWDAHTR